MSHDVGYPTGRTGYHTAAVRQRLYDHHSKALHVPLLVEYRRKNEGVAILVVADQLVVRDKAMETGSRTEPDSLCVLLERPATRTLSHHVQNDVRARRTGSRNCIKEMANTLPLHQPAHEQQPEWRRRGRGGQPLRDRHGGAEGYQLHRPIMNAANQIRRVGRNRRHGVRGADGTTQERQQKRHAAVTGKGQLHPVEGADQRDTSCTPGRPPQEGLGQGPVDMDNIEAAPSGDPGRSHGASQGVTGQQPQVRRPLPDPVRCRLIMGEILHSSGRVPEPMHLHSLDNGAAKAAIRWRQYLDLDAQPAEAMDRLHQPRRYAVTWSTVVRRDDVENLHL